MPKKIKDDSDSDNKNKKKTKAKKKNKGISIKNKNKNNIIININSGKRGKKEKGEKKIIQTQNRPQLSLPTTFISGNPGDKNFDIEISKLKLESNYLRNYNT